MVIHPWSPQSDHIPLFMRSWNWQRPGQYSTLKSNITFAGIIEVIGWDIKPISPPNCVRIYKLPSQQICSYLPWSFLGVRLRTQPSHLLISYPLPRLWIHSSPSKVNFQSSKLLIFTSLGTQTTRVLRINIPLAHKAIIFFVDILFSWHMGCGGRHNPAILKCSLGPWITMVRAQRGRGRILMRLWRYCFIC